MKKKIVLTSVAALALVLGAAGAVTGLAGWWTVPADTAVVARTADEEEIPAAKTPAQTAPETSRPTQDTPTEEPEQDPADGTETSLTGKTTENQPTLQPDAPVTAAQPEADTVAAAATPAPAQSNRTETADETRQESGSAQVAGQTQSNPAGQGGSQAPSGQEEPTPQTQVTAEEVITLTNEARSENGLPALRTETALADAAALRARELATRFDHTRPDGSSCFTVITGSYRQMGENIAYIQGNATARTFLDNWMASTGHRANILSDVYDGMAAGIYYDAASNTTYAVQLFVADQEEVHYTYTDQVVAPTCTEQGYTLHTCNEDPARSYQDSYVDALGHDYQEGTCTRCGAKDPDYVAEPEYTYTDQVIAPTCTEQGYTLHTCNEDPARSYQDSYVDALGHDYQEGTCTRCGAKDPDYVAEPEYTYTIQVVEPTCTELGYTLHICNEDPSKTYKSDFVDSIDHVYEDGHCIYCGKEEEVFHPFGDNYDKTYYNSAIISLTNQARTERGHSELRYASEYQAAADTRAAELLTSFSHQRPDGSNPETVLDELGARYSSVGENIAYVSNIYKPGRIVENWLNSPGHCANMMSDVFDSFVVGTASDGQRVYAVQIFFRDASAAGTQAADIQVNAPEAFLVTAEEPAEVEEPAAQEEPQAETTAAPEPEETPAPTPVEEPAAETMEAPAEEPAAEENQPAPQATPEPAESPETPAPESPAEETPADEEAKPDSSGEKTQEEPRAESETEETPAE